MAKAEFHPSQTTSLDLVPAEAPVILLMRHSIRENGDDLKANFAVPLTEEGIELARKWGEAITGRIDSAWSSQWPRCVDTARAVVEGAGQEVAVEVGDMLCEPGCYVRDMRAAGAVFGQKGPIDFVNLQLGDGGVPGTVPVHEGTGALLRWLRERAPRSGHISLFITHDTILSTFVYELTERRHLEEDDWPWMMEGIFLWIEAAEVRWIWRACAGSKALAAYGID